jgi:tetratricopeptide (TPR) repeat protein
VKSLRDVLERAAVAVCLVCGQDARAERLLDRMVRAAPDRRYPRAARAHLRARTGRPEAALADYAALLAVHADDAESWFNQAFVLEGLGRDAAALASFRRAGALAPTLDRAWYGMGVVLARQRRFDDAAAALSRVTELQPMSPHGWMQLAYVELDRRRPDEVRRIIGVLRGFEPRAAAQLERETGLCVAGAAGTAA